MNITQVQIITFDKFVHDEKIITEFLIGYFQNFDMGRIKNVKELMALFMCLMRVFCAFGQSTSNNLPRKYTKLKIILAKLII